jgi:hypothetical protein
MNSSNAVRVFEDKPAVREATPLLIGLVGPSSSGKTYSALRLATGIQRVSGGDIYGIDTESGRMKHYADKFKFRHLAFGAPFSPLDYLAAIEHCVKKGAKTIIVDSMSHEHEGPGGVLEMHERELDRMAGNDYGKRDRMTMLAWAKPKGDRRRMINTLLQTNANFIFCFRAKEKIKMVKGKEPEQLGFMPIAGEEFVYEMTVKCLLLPGANGTPTWSSDMPGERMMMKKPEQFLQLFSQARQLDEDIGMSMAQWAAGDAANPEAVALLGKYATASTRADYDKLEAERGAAWKNLPAADKVRVKAASEEALKRISNTKAPAEAITESSAIARIREADDLAVLGATWTEIRAAFPDMPMQIELAYTDRKAALEQL